MNEFMRIGVDLAKNVFQVHGVDRREQAAWCKRLPRSRWLQAVTEVAPLGCEIGWNVVPVPITGPDNCRRVGSA